MHDDLGEQWVECADGAIARVAEPVRPDARSTRRFVNGQSPTSRPHGAIRRDGFHDAPRRRVWAIVDARANQGEKDQRWVFWIDTFDFPMVNFTRVSRSERFTVVLQEYEPESVKAKVRLIYFPSARVGAKDKPFIDDVISDLVHERK